MRHSAVLSFLLLTLVLGACSAGSPPAPPIANRPSAASPPVPLPDDAANGAPVIVTFGADERDRLVYEPLIEVFNRDNPDLYVQFVPLDATARLGSSQPAIVQRSMRAIAAGADTFALQLPRAEHISSPLLRDLVPLIDADPSFDRDDFYPLALPGNASTVRMVPLRIEVPLLAYNRELWAGQQLAAPRPEWTWRELLGAAEELSRQRTAEDQVYGLLNSRDANSAIVALLGELQAAGVSIARNHAIDQPEAAQLVERIAALVGNNTLAAPLAADQRLSEDAQPLLRAGNAALWPAEQWPAYMGELPYATGVAAYPPGPLPQPSQIVGVAISSGTQHPTEAWRWLSWLSRQNVDAPAGTALNDYVLPTRISVAEATGVWNSFDAEATAALEATLARPAASDGRASQVSASALTEALLAVIEGGEAAGVALQAAQGTLELELAELAQPAASPASIIVATPAPTPAVPVTRIRFEAGLLNSGLIPQVVQRFNREHETIQVTFSTQAPDAESSLEALAERTDCFAYIAPRISDDASMVRDIQPLIDADAGFPRDDYLPGMFEPFQRDGKLVALPFGVRFRVIGYNKTLFDALGHEYPHGEWSLDDFLRAAAGLTSGDNEARSYGYASPDGIDDVLWFTDQMRAPLFTGSGATLRPNFVEPHVVSALQTYLTTLRAASPQHRMLLFNIEGYRQAQQLRNEGHVAMWLDYQKPQAWIGLDPRITLAMAPPPMREYTLTTADMYLSGLYISDQTPFADACWTWLTYLSNDVAMVADSDWPVRTSMGESTAYAAVAQPGAVDVWNTYRAAMARSSNSIQWQEPVWDLYIERYWLYRALDRALQGQSLDRELADAQFWTEQYLACVQSGVVPETCARQVDPSYKWPWPNE